MIILIALENLDLDWANWDILVYKIECIKRLSILINCVIVYHTLSILNIIRVLDNHKTHIMWYSTDITVASQIMAKS